MAAAALYRLLRPAPVSGLRIYPRVLAASLSSSTRRSMSSYLVTPSELHAALGTNPPSPVSPEPRIIPLCAAWFMPDDEKGRTGIQTFRERRIPKARFFDLDKVVDRRSPYPHMLPTAQDFAAAMSELGIRREDTVVVYDAAETGIFSAPRVAWTLRVFGHHRVRVLNNFRIWVAEGLPTESGELYSVECGPYPIPKSDDRRAVASFEDVKEAVQEHNKEGAEGVQVLDARPHARWTGAGPEPRPGLSSGHMPGSISIPFADVLDPDSKAYRPPDELRRIFEEKGVDPVRPLISSCGSGVTACVVDTALEVAGFGKPETRRVYDGSWTEWAQRAQASESLIRKVE